MARRAVRRLGRADDARRGVVRRRHAELRGTRPRCSFRVGLTRWRSSPTVRPGHPRRSRGRIWRTVWPGVARDSSAWVSCGATASPRTCPTSPRRSSRSSPPLASGAIWSSCAPEFGTRSVVDRFAQIEPTVLLAIDGYRYGEKVVDKRADVEAIEAALPTLRHTVHVPYLGAGDGGVPDDWSTLLAEAGRARVRAGALRPPAVRALQLGHHRPAEGDRARPRRHHGRALQDDGPAPRPRCRRPVLLVHHHRLDDVELPGVGAAGGRHHRALRRRPRVPRPRRAVATGRGHRRRRASV